MNTKKDYTDQKLKSVIENDKIAVLKDGNDSSAVIMDKKDHINEFEEVIKDRTKNGVYETSTDTTFGDLEKHCDKMEVVSNQPAGLYGTAKAHKFDSKIV